MERPELAALQIADPPRRWAALGFTVLGGRLQLGGVTLELGVAGRGIAGWTLRGVDPGTTEIDGLATTVNGTRAAPPSSPLHVNGATGVDHVVIVTPEFDRTAAALVGAGLGLRRVRQSGDRRQGFRRLGPAIMEVVEAVGEGRSSHFWGLTIIVEDLAALAAGLGARCSEIRPAVQPDRHIATLRADSGLSTRLAFMDPEPS